MNKISDLNNYHDLNALSELKAKANSDPENKEALKMAAQHFESIFIGMMLKSMRSANAVFEKDNPMHSNTTNFYRDMYDQQLSSDLASKGSLGLADLIVEQLDPNSAKLKQASLLRNDSEFVRHEFNVMNRALTGLGLEDKSSEELLPSLGEMKGTSLEDSFSKIVDMGMAQIGADKLPDYLVNSNSKDSTHQQTESKPEVNFESPDDFITSMWQYAKNAASKIGVSPAVMIAQSALETGWGKHIIKDKNGESSFNLFNIKALRDWDGDKAAQSTLEFEQGIAVRKVEPFRVYGNFSEAFDDFVDFLKSNQRYGPALESSKDSEQFLLNLQKAGYATDPNYAEKILNILNSDNFKGVIGNLENIADSDIGA